MNDYIKQCQSRLHQVNGNDVIAYEGILEEFLERLKPTHYLVITVKKFLGDLYGLTNGFLYRLYLIPTV